MKKEDLIKYLLGYHTQDPKEKLRPIPDSPPGTPGAEFIDDFWSTTPTRGRGLPHAHSSQRLRYTQT
eukprot:52130-Eustigmatos_ZCMA.PRE.1